MTTRATSHRTWYVVHKWSSLICTVFLFVICLTGLPLVFSEELDDWLGPSPTYDNLPADTPAMNLDTIVDAARSRYPGHLLASVFIRDDEPVVIVAMTDPAAPKDDASQGAHWTKYDSRNGKIVEQSGAPLTAVEVFNQLMLRLHTDMFTGMPGRFFLAAMGLLFAVATVSGIVLYGPFMKKLPFGTVRQDRSPRIRWLDMHNLLGVVTVAWVLVVALTGILNEIAAPLFDYWQATDVRSAIQRKTDRAPFDPTRAASLQGAVEKARELLPGTFVFGALYPGGRFGSANDYFVLAKGATPLTARLLEPVLIDAQSGEVTAVVPMPWYLRLIELSRPLHFGDYGEMPLKIIWAVLDFVTLVVLGTGIYLWLARRKTQSRRHALLAHEGENHA